MMGLIGAIGTNKSTVQDLRIVSNASYSTVPGNPQQHLLYRSHMVSIL